MAETIIAKAFVAIGDALAKTAFTVGNLSVSWGKVALVAATAGFSSYQNRQMKKALASAVDKGQTIMFRDPIATRTIVYGQTRVSGPMLFADTTGTDNEFLHIVVALAGHQCEAVDTVYFDDTALTLDGSGNVTTSPWNGFARVKIHLGSPSQTADSDLVAESSLWTTNHRLRGICYVYVRLKYNAEVFPSGIPNVSALIRGKLVYDPRTTTTAFSSNWALCLADYMTDTELGFGTDYSTLDDTALQAAANVADENVGLNPSGTEKRYTINGVVDSGSDPGTVIDTMNQAGSGFVGFIGGAWIIHAGAYRTPTVTLDENDLRAPISVQTKVSRREIFNGGKGVFISSENQWQPADYPPITNATYTAEDGGRIWQDFEWPFTTSNATAQRNTKIALERVRQQISVRLPCKLTAIQVQAGDNVMVTNARMGWASKVFEVVEAHFVPQQTQDGVALGYDLMLRETASGVWDWNNGEETTIDLAPNTNLPDPRTVAAPTGLTLTSDATTTSIQEDGTVVPRILAEWTAPADQFIKAGGFIRVEYKLTAAPTWNAWERPRGDETESYITAIVTGQSYDVRIRAENRLGGVSSWVSDSITAAGDLSAPATPTGLTATAGAGFVSLDWDDNTESDLGEYGVYRHTSNVFGSATKIAEVLASRFVDASSLVTGTTYYYWITAIDRSDNESTESSSANAAPTAPINTGTPSTPSAPTFSSEATYLAGDGTVFAYIIINTPALPGGAIANDILYRISGSSSWIIADQQYGAGTARIDDLTPGIAYQFAVRSISNGGSPSAVSSVLSRTSPNKSTGPSAPTGLVATAGAGFISLDWNDNTEADLSEYAVYRNTVNSFATSTEIAQLKASRFVDANVTPGTTYYYWITAIDRSENESSESSSANASAILLIPGGAVSSVSGGGAASSLTYTASIGTNITTTVSRDGSLRTARFVGTLTNASGSTGDCFVAIFVGGALQDEYSASLASGEEIQVVLEVADSNTGSVTYEIRIKSGSGPFSVAVGGSLTIS